MTQKNRIIEKVSIMIKDVLTTWVVKHPQIFIKFTEEDYIKFSKPLNDILESKEFAEDPATSFFNILEQLALVEIHFENKENESTRL